MDDIQTYFVAMGGMFFVLAILAAMLIMLDQKDK
jgi:hypothetical protein